MAVAIPIISEYDARGVKAAQKSFAQLQQSAGTVGRGIRTAMMPAIAAVGGLAVAVGASVKAAVEDQAAQAKLAKTLQVSAKATGAQVKANEDFISSLTLATGVADDDLRPALGQLVRATGSVRKAQHLLRTALDVSAGSGKSLNTVAQGLARAYGGNVRALARLDPSLKNFITKTTTADAATARLAQNFRGQSRAAAETYEGRMRRLQTAINETRESIGEAFLPILERMIGFINDKVLPQIRGFADALQKDGLGGAFGYVRDRVGDAGRAIQTWVENAKGWQGFIIDFTITVAAFWAAWKGYTIFTAIFGAFTALQGWLATLGGILPAFAATSVGAIATAFGLAALSVYTLISAMRDPFFRSTFGEVIINSLKLIANAFIAVYKVIRGGINPILSLAKALKIPGAGSLGLLPDVAFQEFTFDARQAQMPAMESRAGSPVTINVNGGDPQATVDAITRWYRQNGANAPWMG